MNMSHLLPGSSQEKIVLFPGSFSDGIRTVVEVIQLGITRAWGPVLYEPLSLLFSYLMTFTEDSLARE